MEFLKKLGRYFLTKHFLKVAAILALVHVLVIGGTIYYLDSYTRHGEKLEVPNMVGMNVRNIASLLEEQNLKFEIVDQVYKPKLAEGTIVSQDPGPTKTTSVFVKGERTIRLCVSKRVSLVEMPNLVDKSERFATIILKNRGLRCKVTYKNMPESSGAVLQQRFKGKSVKPGLKISIGSMIQIIVGRYEGSEPVKVINLLGLTISEARERLSVYPGVSFFPVCGDCLTKEDSLRARISYQSPQFYLDGAPALMPSVGTVSATAVLDFVDYSPKKDPVKTEDGKPSVDAKNPE